MTMWQRALALFAPWEQRFPWLRQFISFGCVGVIGLVADAAVLWLMLNGVGLDAYSGRIVSYLAAATVTWWFNRLFTFKGQGSGHLLRQWAKFVFANLSGFVANYTTYALCINFIPVMQDYKLLALVPASLVGLVFNFTASKRLVFR